MNISYNWLKKYINLELPAEKVSETLTSIGLEVDSVEEIEGIRGGLKGLVVGHVLTCEMHPNSDHLHICTVDLGTGEPQQIVCGAANVAAGQKVIVATIGTILYDGDQQFTIKPSKLRGVPSNGMICAEDEIGVGTDHSGIIVLPPDTPVGLTAKEYYHLESDTMIVVDITPNRSDAASHYGVARDLYATLSLTDNTLKLTKPSVDNFKVDDHSFEVKVTVENQNACPRYSAVTINNVTIKESPEWLKKALQSIGLTPINNVVDVTNYVLFALGQPLHAFDGEKIKGNHVIVKNVAAGTKFTTLDGKERDWTERDMLITSGGEAIALAGVMGGEQTGINPDTSTIVIESACFSPIRVGHTSRRLGINSEAAFRFARTVDPALSKTALMAATNLIQEWCGAVVDYKPLSAENQFNVPQPIKLTRKKLSTYLTWDDMNEAVKILEGFGIEHVKGNSEEEIFLPPTWRPDITIEEDLIEEVGRYRGYNDEPEKLPGELPRRADVGEGMELAGFVRNILMARGYTEVLTYSFLPLDFPEKLRLPEDDIRSKTLTLANPISRYQMAMRTTLLPGLLMGLKTSITSGWRDEIRIFEQGKVFLKDSVQDHIEPEHAAGILFNGLDTRSPFDNRSENFYNVKADVEALIKARGYTPIFKAGHEAFTHAGQTAEIFVDGKKIGFVARLKPAIEQELDVSGVYVFEIDLTFLTERNKPEFKPASQFPASFRDISMLVSKDKSNDEVMEDIKNSVNESGDLTLEKLRLFDIYEGPKGIPEGFRSLAYSLSYRSHEKTLKDEEVEAVHHKVRESLKTKGYVIR